METQAAIIKQAFKRIPWTGEMLEEIAGWWEPLSLKKRTFVTEAGQTEKGFYIVVSGVQCLYLIDQKGDQVVLGFSFPGNFSGVFDSYIRQKPSAFFLEALTDSTLLRLPHSQYQLLFEKYPEFNKWGREFFQNIMLGRVSREVEILTLPARERYITFMRRCPEPLKEIPQKYLASYLNLKPETFSRLRASTDY